MTSCFFLSPETRDRLQNNMHRYDFAGEIFEFKYGFFAAGVDLSALTTMAMAAGQTMEQNRVVKIGIKDPLL
jgi:hypothetical protein